MDPCAYTMKTSTLWGKCTVTWARGEGACEEGSGGVCSVLRTRQTSPHLGLETASQPLRTWPCMLDAIHASTGRLSKLRNENAPPCRS
eukprot:1072155-Pleurochrysis_carterae.AAC.2